MHMSDINQIVIPPSFIGLFVQPGRIKPGTSRETIAHRYEFCEDLALMLTENSKTMIWQLGISEEDALVRTYRGLLDDQTMLSPPEAGWIIRRLAELLEWPLPSRLLV